MAINVIFPWQHSQWQYLWQCHQENRLPHAILLVGNFGMGKGEFAHIVANAILCQAVKASGEPCGACHDCHLIKAETHSGLLSIKPMQVGAPIKIDQIREAVEFVNQTALQGRYRVVIIQPAQAMNHFAANALLKTLEEPSSHTLIILITEQKSYLPATLLSRCQPLLFSKPDTITALTWLRHSPVWKKIPWSEEQGQFLLNLTNGAPLEALRFVQQGILPFRQDFFQLLFDLYEHKGGALSFANQWQEMDISLILRFLFGWLADLIRLHMQPDDQSILNSDQRHLLLLISHRISLKNIFAYLQYLQQVSRDISAGINLNKQLLVESLLIRWQEAAAS